MARIASILLFGSLTITAGTRSYSLGTRLRHGKQFGKLNPEAVAHTFSAVEEKWMAEAVAFLQCNTTDTACQEDTMGEFKKSCQPVVRSLLQGSDGDKSNVAEYLDDVCGQDELHGWKKSLCNNFASALNQVLTDDSLVNRDDLPVDSICSKFVTHGFLKDAAKGEIDRAEKKKEEEEAEEKKAAEEKAAEEAAEAKQREAVAKAEAAKQAVALSAKVREDAQVKAAEAAEATQHSPEETANSSASLPAVNATVSNVNASSDATVTNNSTAPAAPEQVTVASNNTDASAGTNATADPVNKHWFNKTQ